MAPSRYERSARVAGGLNPPRPLISVFGPSRSPRNVKALTRWIWSIAFQSSAISPSLKLSAPVGATCCLYSVKNLRSRCMRWTTLSFFSIAACRDPTVGTHPVQRGLEKQQRMPDARQGGQRRMVLHENRSLHINLGELGLSSCAGAGKLGTT